MNHLPKLNRPTSPKKAMDHSIHFSPLLAEVAKLGNSEVFFRMKTTSEALSTDEADSRWAEVGPNVAAASKHRGWSWRLLSAARNPLVPLVFLIDGFTKHDWQEAFFFSIAVAVGLTPEDAAYDRFRLPVQGRAGDVEEEGHRQTTQRDPELRGDGCALHEHDALHPWARKLAAHADHGGHHGRRRMAALLAVRAGSRIHGIAAALLADPARNAAVLRRAHPNRKDVADPQNMALNQHDKQEDIHYETRYRSTQGA